MKKIIQKTDWIRLVTLVLCICFLATFCSERYKVHEKEIKRFASDQIDNIDDFINKQL